MPGLLIGLVGAIRDGVHATLSNRETDTFDLIIVAEGVHSSTPHLVWGNDGYKPFGIVYVASSLDADSGHNDGVLRWLMGTGRNIAIIPVGDNKLLIQIYFRGRVERGASNQAAKDLLRVTFRDFAPQGMELIERMTAGNAIFCDNVAMITLAELSRGRVALLGDAGYCPTFLSGMGASLGLIGAKAMRNSLHSIQGDVTACLKRYNDLMQPLIRHFQANAERNAENILAQSPLHTKIRDWILREVPPALVAKAWGAQFKSETDLVRKIMES